MSDCKIEVEDITGHIDHVNKANRVLLEFGLFLQKDGDFINYLPGSFDNNGIFYNHHIKIDDKLLLISFREKDLYGKSFLEISEEGKKQTNNPKGFEISLRTVVDYEVTSFIIYANNDFGIFNAVRMLYYLKLFFAEGLRLTELNLDFSSNYTVRLMQKYTEDCYRRIFDFVKALKFFEWSEVTQRIGKDNSIDSGVILVNDIKNNYFSYLINNFTVFKSTERNRFAGKVETDYGYIKSSQYVEYEMNELDAENYRNEILPTLLKNYNHDKEIVYHFYKI